MSATISSLSLEYVRVQVKATKLGAAYDPTSDTVKMAFVAVGVSPQAGDWQTASWETELAGTAGVRYQARCLVGPGGVLQLTAGPYTVWVKITDSPEIPVIQADILTVI